MEYRIQIPIEQQTEYGMYRDAIYLSPVDFAGMSDAEVQQRITDQVNTWLESVKNPPVAIEEDNGNENS